MEEQLSIFGIVLSAIFFAVALIFDDYKKRKKYSKYIIGILLIIGGLIYTLPIYDHSQIILAIIPLFICMEIYVIIRIIKDKN